MSNLCIILLAILTTVHGNGAYFPDLDQYRYGTVGPLRNRISSFKIDIGSCVEAYENDPPDPNGQWFWTDNRNYKSISCHMDNKISTMKSCGRNMVDLKCPRGTFVKRIEWDGSNRLKGGLKLRCMPFSSNTTTVATLNLHANLATTRAKNCFNGMKGLQFARIIPWEVNYALNPDCNLGSTLHYNVYCEDGDAMVGVKMEVENHTQYIKTSSIYCSTSGNGSEPEVKLVEPLYKRDVTRSEKIQTGKVAIAVLLDKRKLQSL
ncbi:hypothetical protein Fcan01_20013 [Folsomia candida]|uniref:Uncharacterized protein n=1 Tax=Folsomia candida TaxID=158441 RepID=A0A226DIV2_FOLCA|nr:hypothetical protein Fcan01_20013 [Folsomia candida]